MKKDRKQISLKWSMLALVLCCWVLPLAMLAGMFTYYVGRSMQQHVLDMVTTTADNAAAIARLRTEEVVDDALDASYNPTLKQAWRSFSRTPDQVGLYNTTRDFLRLKFEDNKAVQLAMVAYLTDEPFYVLYYDTTRFTFKVQRDFQDKADGISSPCDQIMSLAPKLDGKIRFLWLDEQLYLVRCLVDGNFKPYAVLALQLDLPHIFEAMNGMTWGKNFTMQLDDCVMPIAGPPIDLAAWPIEGMALQGKVEGSHLLVSGSQTSEWFQLRYYLNADYTALLADRTGTIALIGITALLVVVLISAVMSAFWRQISRPIGLLVAASKKIEQGELGTQVDAAQMHSAEMQYMAGQFNSMSSQLQHQFERIYREELALRDARIMALQSQINPHFLGNTLEVINWEARLAGNVKVSAMLEALSTILEASMDRRHRSTIRLSEELHYVNAYLTIIGQRLGRRLSVERDIDESLLDAEVPRLVMQPILENAVEHGVGNRAHGAITIRVRRENEEWMLLEVENDAPLTPENEEHIRQLLENDDQAPNTGSTSLGIRNVHQRLRIIYGESSGLSVKNTENGHTVSSMRVRLSQAGQI